MNENSLTSLFKRYGWSIEEVGEKSYVAFNDTFAVVFSYNAPFIMLTTRAVIYHVKDKDAVIQAWKNYNDNNSTQVNIGDYAFTNNFEYDYKRMFTRYSAIEAWLSHMMKGN